MIVLEHSLPLAAVVGAVLAAFALGMLGAWRWLPRGATRGAAAALHGLVLAGLLWCLLQPGRREARPHRVTPRFLVVLDTSQSMASASREGGESRWDRAQRALRLSWVRAVGAQADLVLYPFASVLGERTALDAAADLEPAGESTRLRDSLRALRARYSGVPVAGLLLLSDGIDTQEAGDDWAEDPFPFPVHTVRLEDAAEAVREPDVRIDAVLTPRRVSRGWASELRAVVSGQGTQGQPLTVRLYRDGERLDEKPTLIPAAGGQREVSFPLQHAELGVFTYRVFVPPMEGETRTENNEYVLTVSVSDPRNRVLYVEGVPRFEYRFLRRVLLAGEQIVPVIFYSGPDGIPQGGTPDDGFTAEMTEQDLLQFRVVILGNLSAGELSETRARDLVRFVESGGSLVLLGGTQGWGVDGFARTELRAVLPLRSEGMRALEGAAPFPVRLTPEGRAHPAFAGDGALWERVPPVLGVFPCNDLAPGAEVLVEADTPDGVWPVVVSQRYGQGRVAAILTDSLWRWQLSPEASREQPYARFWAQLLAWMLPGEEADGRRRIDLFTSRDDAHLGDSIELSARFTDPAGSGDGPVEARITLPDGRIVPYAMTPRPVVTPGGRSFAGFHLVFTPPAPGSYSVAAAHGTGPGADTSDPVSFFVRAYSPETEPRPIHADLLRTLAGAAGGQYHETVEELGERLAGWTIPAIEEERSEFRSLWRTWSLLVALMLLLAANWVLRAVRHLP